jgi:SPP1 gp7 family putative phage head morphogenesis protein
VTPTQFARFVKERRQYLGRKGLRRKPIRWFPPDHVERAYRVDLMGLVERMAVALRAMLPQIEQLVRAAQDAQPRIDGPPPPPYEGPPPAVTLAIERIGVRIQQVFTPSEIRAAAKRMADGVAAFNKLQFKRVVKSVVGVDVLTAEPWLADALAASAAENVKLISSIGERAETEIEGIAARGVRGGLRWEALSKEIEERIGVAESRAQLIARDQVSKLNGDLTRLRQTSIGVSQYAWRTSQDERVRESHREKEGKVFEWDDPPADTGHPGEDVNCRCTAEMVLPDDLLG